jgi:hypothetical protein
MMIHLYKPTTSYSLATAQPDIQQPVPVETTRPNFQQPVPVETNPTPLYEVTSASVGFLVLFSSFILLYCSMQRWKSPPSPGPAPNPNPDKFWPENLTFDLPCTRCQYFKANRYLPCAVNPLQVLKPEARNCIDFQERKE